MLLRTSWSTCRPGIRPGDPDPHRSPSPLARLSAPAAAAGYPGGVTLRFTQRQIAAFLNEAMGLRLSTTIFPQ